MATLTRETLLEYAATRGARVDREAGIIRDVRIVGLNSRNGRRYLPEALRGAIHLYEGAKVNIDHDRKGLTAAREFSSRFGELRNVRFAEGEGLRGDLHYLKSHAQAGVVIEAAERMQSAIGLSHNVQGRTRQERGTVVIEAIDKVHSVDLVSDPATTNGLFESYDPTRPAAPRNLREAADRLRGLDSPSSPEAIDELVYGLTGRKSARMIESNNRASRAIARDLRG